MKVRHHNYLMRITLILALLLSACAAPARDGDQREDHARAERPSGPTISIGGGLGTYYGATR